MTTDEQPQPQVARIHRGVNLTRLAAECSSAAGSWPAPVWVAAVDLILGRARSRVGRPQAYVTGSITSEPAVMLDAAEAVAGTDEALGQSLWAGVDHSAPQAATAQPALRRVTCPIHRTDHREDHPCGGCRADRLAQHPQEG